MKANDWELVALIAEGIASAAASRPEMNIPGLTAPEGLAFHLISAHADITAIERSLRENWDEHQHEHDGPGTIRNHPRELLFFELLKIEENLEEAEKQDYGFIRSRLPNGEPGELFWRLPSHGNVPRIGGH